VPENGNPRRLEGGDAALDSALDSALERLPRWIAGVSVVAVAGCIAAGQFRFAAGLGVGACVGMIGYRWLYRGIQSAFDSGRARAPRIVLTQFALRYPLAIGAVLLFNYTGWLPARAVMAGLFAPLAGVLIQCALLAAQVMRGRTGNGLVEEGTEATGAQ
jgi:hypothetical protein